MWRKIFIENEKDVRIFLRNLLIFFWCINGKILFYGVIYFVRDLMVNYVII